MRRAATPLFLATMFAAGFLASFPWADGAERLARASHAAEFRTASASLSYR
jgi:hypothetical protein